MKKFILKVLVLIWGTCLTGVMFVTIASILSGEGYVAIYAFVFYAILSVILFPIFQKNAKEIMEIFPNDEERKARDGNYEK